MSGSVIQGSFRGGACRQAPAPARTVQRARSYDELAREAHQRGRSAVQPAMRGRAFVLPSNVATFGRRPGAKLAPALQRRMESFFKHDFSDVEIHVGPEAASIGALAFTHGSHIYFAPGEYRPDTPAGQQLLGHELTHVVQQRTGRVRSPFGAGIAVVQDPALEAEAERMAVQAASHRPVDAPIQRAVARPAGRIVQRAALKEAKETKEDDVVRVSTKTNDEIVSWLWQNMSYPIGGKDVKAKSGGTGTYDVGADVLDKKGNVIGSGEYSSGEMYHAELVALAQALGKGYSVSDVGEIQVTKGSCRRCAAVLTLLGLNNKVGPKSKSATAGGSYKVPPAIVPLLKIGSYKPAEIAYVIERGTWWA